MWRRGACAALALLLTAGAGALPVSVRAEDMDAQKQERLQDGVIEYDELGDLIEQYNPQVQNVMSAYYGSYTDMESMAEEMREEARDLEDKAESYRQDGDRDTAEAYKDNAKALKKYAKALNDNMDKMEKGNRDLNIRVLENTLTANAQTLMNTYGQMKSSLEVQKKTVELKESMYQDAQGLKSAQMATETDVLRAKKELDEARTAVSETETGMESIASNLRIMTGRPAETEIGEVPEVDESRTEGMEPEADAVKAVGNNYDMINERQEQKKETTNGEVLARKRGIEQEETKTAIEVEGLYGTVMEKREAYEASKTAYESAQIEWEKAQSENGLGMLSRTEYLGKEEEYLGKKAAYEIGDLAYRQAIESYDWAVKGLILPEA